MAETRLEDLEQQKAELQFRLDHPIKHVGDGPGRDDPDKVKARLKTIEDEIAKESPTKKVERTEKVETATRAKAPEKAVTRTSKKG